MDRQVRLAEARLLQPLEELERKADKARARSNLWMQEEIDLARAKGRLLSKTLKGLMQ